MAMVDLGYFSQDNIPVSLADISNRQEIPLSYLEQLFSKLRKSGLVISYRGAKGGYLLSKPASEIYVYDVIVGVGSAPKIVRCNNLKYGGCRSDKAKCLTHDLWAELSDLIQKYLSQITLEDVYLKRDLSVNENFVVNKNFFDVKKIEKGLFHG